MLGENRLCTKECNTIIIRSVGGGGGGGQWPKNSKNRSDIRHVGRGAAAPPEKIELQKK